MEKISRKEAFECAIAEFFATAKVLSKGEKKLYDYSVIVHKGARQPIRTLKPFNTFEWDETDTYPLPYAFTLITPPYETLIINSIGNKYEENNNIYELFEVIDYPTYWIKEVLSKQYMSLTYDNLGYFSDNTLEYDTSFISKCHKKWIRITMKNDGTIIFFPYYTSKERKSIFEGFHSNVERLRDDFWNE